MTAGLLAGLDGRIADWSWEPGLTPEAVEAATGIPIDPSPILHAGRPRVGIFVEVDAQPNPVQLLWEQDGSLALVELTGPVVRPSLDEVRAAIGPPQERVPFGVGIHPEAEQQVYLDRGLTIFDAFNYGISHVWLFRPTDLDGYLSGLGARETMRRPPR